MPRKGISYEDVAAAAESLVAAGQTPGLQAVKNLLGSGSMSTVHKHWKEWTSANLPAKKDPLTDYQFPAAIAKAIVDEISAQVDLVKKGARNEITDLEATNTALSADVARLEAENDTLEREVHASGAEKEQWHGEREGLKNQLAEAERRLDEARRELTTLQVDRAKFEFTMALAEELKAELVKERAARIEAEKQTARLEGAAEKPAPVAPPAAKPAKKPATAK